MLDEIYKCCTAINKTIWVTHPIWGPMFVFYLFSRPLLIFRPFSRPLLIFRLFSHPLLIFRLFLRIVVCLSTFFPLAVVISVLPRYTLLTKLLVSSRLSLSKNAVIKTNARLSVTCCRSVVFSKYSGFLHQWNWPSRYIWNIVWSGVKYHNPSHAYW